MINLQIKNILKFFSNLKFSIAILILIAIIISFGSFIEQDETIVFYKNNYSSINPIFGFIDYNFILKLGLNHIYTTWWFVSFLIIFGFSLFSCTVTRQFPLLTNSKKYFFKNKNISLLPLFTKIKNYYYLNEFLIIKLNTIFFYIYQKKNLIYSYKGLLGRISPILVHISLICILIGSFLGAFQEFKAQEVIAKGEIFHIQNIIKTGSLSKINSVNIRVNDFWTQYKKKNINQFYSNLSILDNLGNEISNKTISVNNPLKYKNIDFYQSDWNLIGIRTKLKNNTNIKEYSFFNIEKDKKIWITWINLDNKIYSLLFDQLEESLFVYDENGNFIKKQYLKDKTNPLLLELLPSTGILIKSDLSIPILYFGFGILIITTLLSCIPYNQIWISSTKKNIWIGSKTNRGFLNLELEFENFLRNIEQVNKLKKNRN